MTEQLSDAYHAKQCNKEVIITTYSQSNNGSSAYSYLIREDNGQETLESKVLEDCSIAGKAELIAIVAALRTLASPSLVLLFPYHTTYLAQEFSNLENGIKHISKHGATDIFDELAKLLKYHDVLIEYSKELRPETELLQDTTTGALKERASIK